MVFASPQYRTTKPLRISILGASGVGKTSIALQYVTNQASVETSPTKIEDVFRKEVRITVPDEEMMRRIRNDLNNPDPEHETLLETCPHAQENNNDLSYESLDISLSLKITDTAGYIPQAKPEETPPKGIFSRLTLKRNYQVQDDVAIETKTSAGEVYRSRKNSGMTSVRVKDRHANSLMNCDGLMLVYNVLDEKTFETACEIRNRFVQMHSSTKKSQEDQKKTKKKLSQKLLFGVCVEAEEKDSRTPPVYLVGTHADARVEQMANENSSRVYDLSFLRSSRSDSKKQTTRKQKLRKTATVGRNSVYPHDVYPVISEWKECAGFAEITSGNAALVERIFEQLNLAVVTPPESE